MKNTTFCILLASALMLMGAVAASFMKTEQTDDTAQEALAASEGREELEWIFPASGAVYESFGAQYSEEYGHWMLREYMTLSIGESKAVCAPADGIIQGIDEEQGGGSRLTLQINEAIVRLWPVEGVRVFEGSRIEQGTALGIAEDLLSVQVELDGRAVNPEEMLGNQKMN